MRIFNVYITLSFYFWQVKKQKIKQTLSKSNSIKRNSRNLVNGKKLNNLVVASFSVKTTKIYIRYFTGSTFQKSLAHKKNVGLI